MCPSHAAHASDSIRSQPSRWLLAIGGGKRPIDALTRARDLTLSTSAKPQVLVIAWASEVPDEAAHSAAQDLSTAGFNLIIKAPHSAELTSDAVMRSVRAQIESSRAIFFTGGDQTRLMNTLLQFKSLSQAIREAYQKGVIMIGTSAGTAFMGKLMITGEGIDDTIDKDVIETSQGIGFFSQLIFDQHFLKRKRQNRLLSVLLDYPRLTGVGIDEETALLLKNESSGEVFGRSKVSVFSRVKMSDSRQISFLTTLLSAGDHYDFKNF
jgi:cyanophycinase